MDVIYKNLLKWIVIALVLFSIIYALFYYVEQIAALHQELRPELILANILVIGVIALIIALTFMTVIFKSLELTDTTQTLGLPEGSIRAVIALSLILIFMISSVFLYYDIQIKGSKEYLSRNVTQEQINAMPKEEIVSITQMNETHFNVVRLVETGNKTAEDIAKQIITTVSTLVVAVAGFYFGTRAVTVARGDVQEISVPVIRTIKPDRNDGKRDTEIPFEISGKNFKLPKVKLVRDSNEITDFSDITSSPTKIKGLLKIPSKSDKYPGGKWTVVVTNSDNEEDRLDGAFEVSETPTNETHSSKT